MNYLNALDSIGDGSKIYFLPVNSTDVISYNNSSLVFHVIDLLGNKITDIPGEFDDNGVYLDPSDLAGIPAGKVYGLYLEITTNNTRDYYPGQTVLYLVVSTDSTFSISQNIPLEYLEVE